MAIVTPNPLVQSLSGMLGRALVFKNYNGKTIVASRPRSPKTQSEGQKANRNKFRKATLWAKQILKHPERKAYYQQKAKQLDLPNAYTAAITDYMRKPVMTSAKLKDKIYHTVFKKDFMLKQVRVKRADGHEIIPVRLKSEEWMFETLPGEAVRIIVTSANGETEMMPDAGLYDSPGHI